uniref:YfjI family protein n=1 Tax=Streptomyces sp. NBC_00003 TaxID=2903608 RepID=A0AAU2UZJ7_9ACTN
MYGPIGRAVRKIAPFLETDALGVYVAALSMWSAAIGGTVTVSSRGNARPVLLWSALVAGTGRGKGTALRAAQHAMNPALGRFLATHTTSGITSGP